MRMHSNFAPSVEFVCGTISSENATRNTEDSTCPNQCTYIFLVIEPKINTPQTPGTTPEVAQLKMILYDCPEQVGVRLMFFQQIGNR